VLPVLVGSGRGRRHARGPAQGVQPDPRKRAGHQPGRNRPGVLGEVLGTPRSAPVAPRSIQPLRQKATEDQARTCRSSSPRCAACTKPPAGQKQISAWRKPGHRRIRDRQPGRRPRRHVHAAVLVCVLAAVQTAHRHHRSCRGHHGAQVLAERAEDQGSPVRCSLSGFALRGKGRQWRPGTCSQKTLATASGCATLGRDSGHRLSPRYADTNRPGMFRP